MLRHSPTLLATFLFPTIFSPAVAQPGTTKNQISIATDLSWEVSGRQTHFGEYPLSAELIASATSPLYGWTTRVEAAEHNGRGKLVPGTMPIWRYPTADSEGEAYQFRKNVPLGPEPIRKATLEINCDDVARVYINKRLVSVDNRDGKLKDGYDDWFLFRSVSGFMYDRIYTYDVTDYFFTNVTNTIVVEAVSMAFDGSHAYISAKVVIELGPIAPQPARPAPTAPPARPKPAPAAKTTAPTPASPSAKAAETGGKAVFEAGHDPEIEKLQIGSVLELGNVFFKADDYRLDAASYRTLDALAAFMLRHPALKIEVGGHTNLRPDEQFAARLSENRARAVRQYLMDKGVSPDRITYRGYGKSRPRIQGISPEADRANQRVEVKITDK